MKSFATANTTDIHGAPSWILETEDVKLAVTRSGGHMAPVSFRLGERWVQPYSLPPWKADDAGVQQHNRSSQVLRGDFFCLPFGSHPCTPHSHGDSANADWTLQWLDETQLRMSLESCFPKASLTKKIHLNPGQTALYIEHEIRGLDGRFSYGHHPILHFPENAPPAELSMSPWIIGEVVPCDLNDPSIGQRSVLVPGGRVEGLDQLPRRDGGSASLASYPALEGCEEAVMFGHASGDLAWRAVVMDDYVWFSIRRVEDFPCSLLWVSNGGRDASPWNGIHTRRLGVEDICGYAWLDEEAPGAAEWREQGIATGRTFHPNEPVRLRHIQAVADVPADSGAVCGIEFLPDGGTVRLIFTSGETLSSNIDWKFLKPTTGLLH